jgi:hypothetical protein
MTAIQGGENNDAVTALFHAANAHARLGDIYGQFYDAWTELGGDLFCHYSSVGKWSKWGSWGLMEYGDQDPMSAPKFRASIDWARRLGQQIGEY